MEENNKPIKVNFPKEMRVHSPEINSIKETSNRISTWLHNDLKNIIEPLTVVRFIPDILEKLSKTIVRQFTNLLAGQVEGDVINRQANIKVLNKKIESTNAHIVQKEESLDKTVERVDKRYKNLSEELNLEHETFLRKLDSQAYEIIDKIYPNQIQNKFSFDSIPSMNFLSEHAMASVIDRSICLDQGFSDATLKLNEFIDKRQLIYNDIKDYETNSLEEGIYEIPWCFVEMENRKTGDSKIECWFECELENLEKDPNLNELRSEIELNASFQNNSQSMEVKETLNIMEEYLDEELLPSEKHRLFSDIEQI